MNERPARELAGSDERRAVQHANGTLTAAERLAFLFDGGTFEAFAGESGGLLAGRGQINGRTIFVYARDITLNSGALTQAEAETLAAVQVQALAEGVPLIGLFDSNGLDAAMGARALLALSTLFKNAVLARGRIPQFALIMGPCIGAESQLAGLADFTFMLRDKAVLYVTGPEVVQALSSVAMTAEDLGGAVVHMEISGLADAGYDNDVELLLQMRRFVKFLPAASDDAVPCWQNFDDPQRCEPSLDSLVPDDPTATYDVKELIVKTLDEGDFFELQAAHAQNLVVGFGRIEGRVVGVIANQSLVLGGVIDCDAALKATRFIRFCDAFNTPLVNFIDVPGFLPGLAQEKRGLARHGADLLAAYAQAKMPKLGVVIRKAFGAASLAMGAKRLGADRVFAWPSADMGLRRGPGSADPQSAVVQGLVDAVIAPRETRPRLVAALRTLRLP